MSNKLKCPFCGAELKKEMAGDIETGRLVCCTKNCPAIDQNLFPDVWELLTTGKKAQEDLKYVEEELECAKHNYSVLCEQKKIAYQNYLKITGDLQMQLQKTQEALKVAIDALSNIDAFNCDSKGAIEIMAGMVSIANGALYKITSITKQE